MSFQAFATMFESAANRLSEIQLLVSPDDLPSGIINDDTECDKAYWENVGPADVTGTPSSAVIDLFRVLHAREDGAILKLGYVDGTSGRMTVSSVGVGIGADPSGSYDLVVGAGGISTSGPLSVDGASVLSGAVSFGDSLAMGIGKVANFGSFDLRLEEEVHTATLGQIKQLFSIDQTDGCIVLRSRYDDPEKWEVDPVSGLAGDLRIDSEDGSPCFFFATNNGGFTSANTTLHIIGDGVTRTKPWKRYDVSVDAALSIIGDSSASVYLMTDDAVSGQQRLMFRQITGESTDSKWTIERVFSGSGTTDTLNFALEGDTVLKLSENLVHVTSVVGYDAKLLISSTLSETAEFMEFVPNLHGEVSRGDEAGGALRIGWRNTYVGVLRQDSTAPWASLRLYYDEFSLEGSAPNVAIGKPLGVGSEPLDCLNVMDTPFLVAINSDHKWLQINYATKEGLWIGPGNASSTYKAARICLQDQVGERSAIQWGIAEEIFTQFVKDGVMKLTTTIDSNAFGDSVKGFMALPTMVTADDLVTNTAAIESEIQMTATDVHPGAAVLVHDMNDKVELWVVDYNGLNWARFESLGTLVAVS